MPRPSGGSISGRRRPSWPAPTRAPDLFRAMNAALSYGHRVLDLLLRARGEGNHVSRDFAGYHDLAEGGDE